VVSFGIGCGTSSGASFDAHSGEAGSAMDGAVEAAGGLVDGGDAGASEGQEASAAAKCGAVPTLLVDYVLQVPDAGRTAVVMPDIAVNATDLYYLVSWYEPVGSSAPITGYLMRIPLGGGTAVRMASIHGDGSQSAPQLLAVTPSAAIFGTGVGSDGGTDELVSVAAKGGEATVLATTSGIATAIVTDDQNVYFVDHEGTKSVPLTGGTIRTLGPVVFSIGVAGQKLYLAGATLSSVPVQGGPITVVASDQSSMFPIGCGSTVCWLDSDGQLMRLGPGGTPVVLFQGFTEPHALVFDGNDFFFTVGASGLALFRVPSAGGTGAVVESEVGITGLALDEACIYWSSISGIWSLARSTADVAGATDE
jgi:hypothetical protein